MEIPLLPNLPGWEAILFIILVIAFLLVGAIITFKILAKLRWPFTYVILENVSGQGYSISRRGRARIVSFGDGGEEIFLLKHINKYRIGYGKRIGFKQVAWAIGEDGLWYQFSFGDLNKILREIGITPVSVNVRMGMASLRKGLEKNLGDKSFMEKYGLAIGLGLIFIMGIVFAGGMWYQTKENVKIAQTNADALKTTQETLEAMQKALGSLDNILSRISLSENQTSIGGSGLVSNGS